MQATFLRVVAGHIYGAERTGALEACEPLFAPLVPPIKRSWGKLIATGLVFAVGLVGFCVLVLIVAEASR